MRDDDILGELGLLTEGEPSLDAPLPAITYKAMSAVSRWFDTEIYGAEHVPQTGPALLVGNHALLGIDSWALMPTLIDATGRYPRALMLRSLFETPILGPILRELGGEPGERGVACELLEAGNVVVVYPGGARDSMKGRDEKYELCWGERSGFAAVAIEAGCPVIPVAAIGPDDVFVVLSRRGLVHMNWLGSSVPLFVPLARRPPFRFYLGEAILPPERDDDSPEEQAARFAAEVRASLTTLIHDHLPEDASRRRPRLRDRLLRRSG